jgi:hypothetical protein
LDLARLRELLPDIREHPYKRCPLNCTLGLHHIWKYVETGPYEDNLLVCEKSGRVETGRYYGTGGHDFKGYVIEVPTITTNIVNKKLKCPTCGANILFAQ